MKNSATPKVCSPLNSHRLLLLTTGVCLSLFPAAPVEAATRYHVRPYTVVTPSAISDGLKENSATYHSLYFSDATRTVSATTDIADGSLTAYVGIDDAITGGMALAEYSETFTLRSGAGTLFEFYFDFDGQITADAKSIMEGGIYQLQIFANLAVFRAGEADWNNWHTKAYTNGEALFADSYQYSKIDTDVDIDEYISESLSYQTLLGTNFEQFHVFARIQLVVNANTPQTASIDFLNTGVLGFQGDPDVEVFSASGEFPNTAPVPEPTSVLLLVACGSALLLRRRR